MHRESFKTYSVRIRSSIGSWRRSSETLRSFLTKRSARCECERLRTHGAGDDEQRTHRTRRYRKPAIRASGSASTALGLLFTRLQPSIVLLSHNTGVSRIRQSLSRSSRARDARSLVLSAPRAVATYRCSDTRICWSSCAPVCTEMLLLLVLRLGATLTTIHCSSIWTALAIVAFLEATSCARQTMCAPHAATSFTSAHTVQFSLGRHSTALATRDLPAFRHSIDSAGAACAAQNTAMSSTSRRRVAAPVRLRHALCERVLQLMAAHYSVCGRMASRSCLQYRHWRRQRACQSGVTGT